MSIINSFSRLGTHNNIKKLNNRTSKSMEKLSSGMSINRASDDSAGLSISEGMRAKIRGLKQATRNTQDTYSMLQTSDGALDEVGYMLQRMRELTIQSLNDSLTNEDRLASNAEFEQLRLEINNILDNTEFNTIKVFESNKDKFYSFGGNQSAQGLIKIVQGLNDSLELSVDGQIYNITVEQGYYSKAELLDEIDNKLINIDDKIIITKNPDKTVSLQAQDSLSIDYIAGGLSSLLYEYVIGEPPGMIIGVTEFNENGRLKIEAGHNDSLNFYVGSSKEYTINFTPSSVGYTIDELISTINSQLNSMGETEVEARKYNDKYISLFSNKYVITGLSGNMIKIDGKTSVLYDNAKYAQVIKTQATVTGSADLSSGITIKKDVNDTLNISVDNPPIDYSINLLEFFETEKTFSIDELINRINTRAFDLGIDIIASKITTVNGTHLKLSNTTYGDKSVLNIKNFSNSFNDLFVRKVETYHLVNPVDGANTVATVTGNYTIGDSTKIIENINDIIRISIDGVTKNIKIDSGTYSKVDLLSKLNEEFLNEGLNITATFSGLTSSGNEQIVIKHNSAGAGSIVLSTDNTISTAFRTLFVREELILPSVTSGTTTLIPPPEGIVAPPTEVKNPANINGYADFTHGMVITNENNSLNLNMNGNDINIVLDSGNYTATSFLSMISSKLDSNDIIASYTSHPTYGLNLSLTSKQVGAGNYFSSIGGNAYNDILVGKQYYLPSNTSSYGGVTKSYIEGITPITSGVVIDDSNNEFSFKYNHEGNVTDINLLLDNGNYSNLADLITHLNTKLSDELGILDGEILFSSNYSRIRMTATHPGANYTFSGFDGDFYDNYLRKTTIFYPPNIVQGYSNSSDLHTSFIVGRESLNKEITINPGINDTLIFDFYKDSVKDTFEIKLSPGLYNGASIVSEMQLKLNNELTIKGYPTDLLKIQVGGVSSGTSQNDSDKLVIKYDVPNDGSNNSGNYIIDGVRGNAAYTVFYQSYGEPEPTYTVGVKDISNGVNIIAGENDVFSFKENNNQISFTITAGEYDIDNLVSELNSKLIALNSDVIASAYEGRLKLSFNDVGANTIDTITGSARGEIFFDIENREQDVLNNYQIGPDAQDVLTWDKTRISTELMRINTIMIHTNKNSKKALLRIDNAIEYNLKIRSLLGARQNRLESIIRSNEVYSENIEASESRIRDIDFAKEKLELVKVNFLNEAALMISSQTNKNSQSILQLLK